MTSRSSSAASWREDLGRALFRARSFTAIPVALLILVLLWDEAQELTTPFGALDYLRIGLGVACSALGQALRAYVLGHVPEGTSGQSNYFKARMLNTAGAYAHVRNPLYVGNFLICLGLLLVIGSLPAAIAGLLFFAVQYHFIVAAEEAFLRQTFGEEYARYLAAVPRWLWKFRVDATQPHAMPFDWRRAVRKEHNPFALWATAMLAWLGLHAWMMAAWNVVLLVGALEVLVVAFWISVKAWKRGWFRRTARQTR